MLSPLLAHTGSPPAPHDLATAWNLDPLLLALLAVAAVTYRRGRARMPRRREVWRGRAFTAALVAIAIALVSPLEPLSSALASGHMVQHLLLVVVAPPLLALSAPGSTLLRGSPLAVRRIPGATRRLLRLRAGTVRLPSHPATVWLLHVAVLWFWHSATAYGAALEHTPLHVLEHASFLVSGVLVWRIVVGPRTPARVPNGVGVLVVFGLVMQSVFLSVLLTFAREPWYDGYATTTAAWGLDPLADQQLAGVLMWVPASAVYVGTALALLAAWIRGTEPDPPPVTVGPVSTAGTTSSDTTVGSDAGRGPADVPTVASVPTVAAEARGGARPAGRSGRGYGHGT